MPVANAQSRFSDRVADYIRSRPGYPERIIDILGARCGLRADAVVADIGSGTGLLARPFLGRGHRVFGVEPNAEMRAAGDRLLGDHPRFVSVAGCAEGTGLADASVDLVTAGQAFHWFDRARARGEFCRILRPGGWVALLWNDRRTDSSPFLRAYEALLVRHCPEYLEVVHRNVDAPAVAAFFAPAPVETAVVESAQRFDWEGLRARHLSMSYVPHTGPACEACLSELQALYERHAVAGLVEFEYDTRAYFGRLAPA
jgi:SAM-dependent methyltransferase